MTKSERNNLFFLRGCLLIETVNVAAFLLMRSEKILGACFKSCWNNNKWRACFSTVCLEKIPKCLWMCQLSFKWKCFLLPLKNLAQTIVFAEPLLLGDVWFLNWDSECVWCHMFEGSSLWDVWIMPCAANNKAGWLQFGAFFLPFFDSSQSFFFEMQRLPGPLWSELQVDTAGEEIFQGFDVWFRVNKGECDVHARKDTN